jgi:hypothetical protein
MRTNLLTVNKTLSSVTIKYKSKIWMHVVHTWLDP